MNRYLQYGAAVLLALPLRHHSELIVSFGDAPVILAAANACPSDCGKECYKKRWGVKYDDPVCRAACEARRALCKHGVKVPTIPGITDPSLLPPDPREIYYGACAKPFNYITGVVRASCKNYSESMRDANTISSAKSLLFVTGMAQWEEFGGVRIRWCNTLNSDGFAPAPNEIYLDAAWTTANLPDLAALLLHELQHIRQWRRHGDSFPCKYSEAYVACGGCQDGGHRLEREAYDIEEAFYSRLNVPARSCSTSMGNCPLPPGVPFYWGMSCSCGQGTMGRAIPQ